jgi:glycine betaine/proline transport system ATP-binding protein
MSRNTVEIRDAAGFRNAIEIREVVKIFGSRTDNALELLRAGKSKEEIRNRTGATVGVNQVSLDIRAGELFVVMGLSGSGKSTLLRLLNRLIEPTAGTITIDGSNILDLSKKELLQFRQKKLAMVFQQFALLPHRTVAENVAFGLELQDMPKIKRLQIANEKLELVGLGGWGDVYPGNLSGGMQQRVGLARALANDPDILLMDEAFSALDPLIRDDMQNELLQLQQRLRKTIVFITHDLNEALKLGDHIALMKDGEVVQAGRPDEIITSPANAYVSRFVRGVDMTKILVAEDVMKQSAPLLRLKDGPGAALHTLREEGFSSGIVVNESRQFAGIATANMLTNAMKERKATIAECSLEMVEPVLMDTPFDELVQLVVRTAYPLAVVDDKMQLQGHIVKSSILEALAAQGGEVEHAEASVI